MQWDSQLKSADGLNASEVKSFTDRLTSLLDVIESHLIGSSPEEEAVRLASRSIRDSFDLDGSPLYSVANSAA